jgi:LysM repeat protein
VPLTVGKQRALCLGEAHRTCSVYAAARSSGDVAPVNASVSEGITLWPPVRTTPLVLEPVRTRLGVRVRVPRLRSGGQAMLVGLMLLSFGVVVVARAIAPPIGAAPTPDASVPVIGPGPSVTPRISPFPATASPAVTGTPEPSSAPVPTPAPTLQATASVAPLRTYTVRPGDTLYAIARRFDTTVAAIAEANGISDTSRIRIGQRLVIP